MDSTFINIITLNETRVYEYDMQTNQQSSEWRLENEPKLRQSVSKIKSMLTVFCKFHGVVHCEFPPKKQIVNKEYYFNVMRRLREIMCQICRKTMRGCCTTIMLHRTELSWCRNVWQQIQRMSLSNHPTCLIWPHVSVFFPKLKQLKSNQHIKDNSVKALKAKPQKAYKRCMEHCINLWNCYGKCIESDKINFLCFIFKFRALLTHDVYVNHKQIKITLKQETYR